MLRLTFLRNGSTEGEEKGRYIGSKDEALTAAEREKLRTAVAPEETEAVFCSPMKRCLETAVLLYPSLSARVIPELKHCDYGAFADMNYQELQENEVYRKWMAEGGSGPYPEGESMSDFRKRCLEGLEKVVAEAWEQEWQEVLLVVSEDVLRVLLAACAFPREPYEAWHVAFGEGYRVRFHADAFLAGEQELVVDKKVRLF